jgi:phosphoglycolate phosphatase
MIKAVIVDFDDTLCLTEAAGFELENEVLRLMGRPPMTREIHKATWGQLLSEAVRLRSPGVDAHVFEKLLAEVQATWVAEGRFDIIDPDNLATLDTFLKQGKEVYILTSRSHGEVAHLLAPDHLLASRVKALYYKDIMEYHKPDPRAFDILLTNHDLHRNECVYVGDSPGDAAAAKQGGLHFIATLESGIRTPDDFAEFAVDHFVYKFVDLPEAVARLA